MLRSGRCRVGIFADLVKSFPTSIPWMVQRPKKMKAPIGPDIVQPGPAMPYRERRRPKERRQDVAKRHLLEIRGRRIQRRQE